MSRGFLAFGGCGCAIDRSEGAVEPAVVLAAAADAATEPLPRAPTPLAAAARPPPDLPMALHPGPPRGGGLPGYPNCRAAAGYGDFANK